MPASPARPPARGDVVLVPFPFSDLSQSKLRPAVVLWSDPAGVDVLVAFVTSRDLGRPEVGGVALLPTHPEFAATGLATASRIRATKLVTLSRALARRWLGRLGPQLVADLDRPLVSALALNTLPYREEGRRDERSRLLRLHAAGGAAAVVADLQVGH
jgi:mRNA-degrading endonuclease toxin of MazEF toxin-antitoxin module